MSLASAPVVLASASRTRRQMLENAGLAVIPAAAAVDESEIKESFRAAGLKAEAVAEALAELKASRISPRHPGHLIIGADQMLDCEGRWFDKPENRGQALAQLQALRGRTHRLISCAVVLRDGERLWHHVDVARVTMRPCSDAFLEAYLDTAGEAVQHSVGAYQLEGLGAQLFNRVEGDYFTVLGLPLLPVLDFLRIQGVLPS